MDINEQNLSKIYALLGAESLLEQWRLLAVQRSEMDADEWIELVREFLRRHARLVGSPSISPLRTTLYQSLGASSDLDRVVTEVTRLVGLAEAFRVQITALDRAANPPVDGQ